MAKYVYVQSTGRLAELWQKLANTGRPNRVDKEWLARLGLTHKSDVAMIRVLQVLGYVDQEGAPTDKWGSLRVPGQNAETLSQAIKEYYADLYNTFPNAHELSTEELTNFFRADTDVAITALRLMVNTYRTLCALAGLVDDQPPSRSRRGDNNRSAVPKAATKTQPVAATATTVAPPAPVVPTGSPMGIHINIELHLPASTESEVYDKLFAALRKHLLNA